MLEPRVVAQGMPNCELQTLSSRPSFVAGGPTAAARLAQELIPPADRFMTDLAGRCIVQIRSRSEGTPKQSDVGRHGPPSRALVALVALVRCSLRAPGSSRAQVCSRLPRSSPRPRSVPVLASPLRQCFAPSSESPFSGLPLRALRFW